MKKLILSFLMTLIVICFVSAQDVQFSENLMHAYNKGKTNALKKDASIKDHLWLTPILQLALTNWDRLTPEAKQFFNGYRNRPTIANEQLLNLGNFRFHYTTTSGDPDIDVDATDNDSNGVPDYIDNMADIFVNMIFDDDHTTMGLSVPPPDGTTGGNALYDVYVSAAEAGSGVYGFVAAETQIGDNPNSTGLTETDAMTSYMVMRSNYSGFSGGTDTCISVTAAHEYFHAIQNGYNSEMGIWLMEMTAPWAEDYNFSGYDDNFQYLMGVFGTPDIAMNLNDNDDPDGLGGHWYATWIFWKYVTEQTDDNITKSVFERTVTNDDIDAIDNELTTNWSSDFSTMFEQFLISNIIMDSATAYDPYIYWRAPDYENYITNNGDQKWEDNITYSGSPSTWSSTTNGNKRLMRLSADYFDITSSQDFSVTLTPTNTSADLDIVFVKQNTTNETIDVVNSTQVGNSYVVNVTNAGNYDRLIAMVKRFDDTVTDTLSEQYTLNFGALMSIGEFDKTSFNIYPNPVSENINLVFNEGNNCQAIKIIDLLGNVVTEYKNLSGDKSLSLNVSGLSNGTYFISVIENDGKIETEKLFILH